MTYEKTTVLDGYFATGDWEAFCFDKHKGPDEHFAARHEFDHLKSALDVDEPLDDPTIRNSCRVYPDELLPEAPHAKGRWTITIKFEPDDPEAA